MNNSKLLLCVIIICFLDFSCKEKTTQPELSFTGITETNSTGPTPIGSIDPDDWKPMMNCNGMPKLLRISAVSDSVPVVRDTVRVSVCTKIYPAYPNPANKSFVIVYSLSEADSVFLTLNSTPTTVVKELVKQRQMGGTYSIYVNGSDLSPAIYRVYISVFRKSDVLQSYGDVQIVN